ncbi:hypothetical protein LCGC14_0776380 [marine sediment metagenome]|uniref:Uncharacterized protein n=1 Tax=marine sediment metagenome TaxID=412755 RepID=A0A0F9PWZ2_9ZZZZ
MSTHGILKKGFDMPDLLTNDDGLNPNRLVETRWLAYRWGFDGPRRIEQRLEKLNIRLISMGKGVNLVRIQDIWDRFDEPGNPR